MRAPTVVPLRSNAEPSASADTRIRVRGTAAPPTPATTRIPSTIARCFRLA